MVILGSALKINTGKEITGFSGLQSANPGAIREYLEGVLSFFVHSLLRPMADGLDVIAV